jgi:hypothetical protein
MMPVRGRSCKRTPVYGWDGGGGEKTTPNHAEDSCLSAVPVRPAVPVIAMSLNQISRAGAGACSDQRAFSATNHRASNSTDTSADQRSFESAVVRPLIAPVTPLRICTYTAESAQQQNQTEKDR